MDKYDKNNVTTVSTVRADLKTSDSTRNQVDEEPLCGCATSKSLLFFVFIFIFS